MTNTDSDSTSQDDQTSNVQAHDSNSSTYATVDGQSGGRRRRKSRGKSRRGSKRSKVKKTKGKKGKKGKKHGTRKLHKALSGWIGHVKSFAKMHKMKYPQALKDPRCKKSYKK